MTTPSCVAKDDGRECRREAVMTRPVALCEPHRIVIAMTVVPAILRDHLALARHQLAAPPYTDLIGTATVASLDALMHGVHDSVVYFIANGGRVKIGYTTNLKSRLTSLSLRENGVLLALHGGPDLERALHSRFAAHRDGNTEWFELTPEIFRFIAGPDESGPAATPVASDPLTPKARIHFGNNASVRQLRKAFSIGQDRAQRIRDELTGAK